MTRLFMCVTTMFAVALVLGGCSTSAPAAGPVEQALRPTPAGPVQGKHPDYCSHNVDSACPRGSYKGPHVATKQGGGHWNSQGAPVHGGPTGADGSTGNNLTQETCAKSEDPGCPVGSFVGSNAIQNPNGSHTFVRCEGTICTNPNHGGGDTAGHWSPQGAPVNGGPGGADGSSGTNLTQEFCAQNEDPGCPIGSYVGRGAIKSPTGDNAYVSSDGN